MSAYPCAFGCPDAFPTWREARTHVGRCPERKRRLAALGTDLVAKVVSHKLTLDEAEALQRARPVLVL